MTSGADDLLSLIRQAIRQAGRVSDRRVAHLPLLPAMILIDIQMPGMDGLEAIGRLRSEEPTRSIPIAAVTALAMPGDRERCLAAGANEYLMKPVSLKLLRELVERYVRTPG